MSVLAAVSAGALFLTALPSTPLSWLTRYTLPADVAEVADRIPFTEAGRSIFEATHPELLSDGPFRRACDGTPGGSGPDTAATVGCFYGIGDTGRIAIFEPTDERLDAQVTVTAAHEFLHAAYHQLIPAEQDRLDALLAARWAQLPADDPLQASLAFSVQDHTESVGTEEFAYLGSEVPDVGAELEAFYAPYFADRQAVVAFDDADEAMWLSLDATYESALAAVGAADQVAADAAGQLETDRAQLDADRARLDADRQSYNQRADQYNALSPTERPLFSVVVDGVKVPWGDQLAAELAGFDTRAADLAARDAALVTAQTDVATRESEAAAARAEAERLYADYNELVAASRPQ